MLPVSTTIIGVDTVAQLEQNVAFASSFTPLCAAEMRELRHRHYLSFLEHLLPLAQQKKIGRFR
ncbi:MAG TPA: hypothetical protein VN442_01345 [Bryobacteraceae bacterium]|nr:hypothetical protein [Bryobacteraceae bacterium]